MSCFSEGTGRMRERRRFKPGPIAVATMTMVLASVSACSGHAMPDYDLVVRGGMIYDGSGGPPFPGDVAIRGNRIVHVGPHAEGDAVREIDARGQAVAPGFINAMSHATYSLARNRTAESDLRQGVTLVVMGEGSTAGPLTDDMAAELRSEGSRAPAFAWRTLGEYLERLEEQGISINFAGWVGATTVRRNVLGDHAVAASPDQLSHMRRLVRQAMEEGALGVATALGYPPGVFADHNELVVLAAESGKCGGIYVSHMRSEGDHLLESVDELIDIARHAGAPATIFHLKASGRRNWPKLPAALDRIRVAQGEGIPITANMYTYAASATGLLASVPPWVQEGGMAAFRARIKEPRIRARVIAEMRDPEAVWENAMRDSGGPSGVVLTSFDNEAFKQFSGMTLAQAARIHGKSAEETLLDLIEAETSYVGAIYFDMDEDNLQLQVQEPYVAFGSDAPALTAAGDTLHASVHPRAYGTFARVFSRFVRNEKLLTVQEAVRRMTSLPASSYMLMDRGSLKPGYFADVVIFDPDELQDHATYAEPHRYATGVSDVIVNGVPVLAGGQPTDARPGRFVRGRAWTGRDGGGCRASASAWNWK